MKRNRKAPDMPGMGSGLRANNLTIVSAFRTTLIHQALLILIIVAILALAWNVLWAVRVHRTGSSASPGLGSAPEAAARRLLRYSFGILWIFDGILQAQTSMPLGMSTNVIAPTAAASPEWVRHIVNAGATIWTNHPITAPTSAVWIQVGLGLFLIAAPRGVWSRVAALTSVGWGLVVWVVGESFGGIFAPGASWLFGTPGAVVFYCVAGVLIALPERTWSPRMGRSILTGLGVFFVAMAVLQAWPGRGFWQGRVGSHADTGSIAAMTSQMAQTNQPHVFSSLIRAFTTMVSAHGWAVNLVVVTALAVIGLSLVSRRPKVISVAVVAGVALCLVTWVLIQDFGFFGGVGTDPNSMVPIALLIMAGYVALRHPSAYELAPTPITSKSADREPWLIRVATTPALAARVLAALGAAGILLVGAVPMAVASTNPNADPILAQAIDGSPGVYNQPAPSFTLVNQSGHQVTLASLRGRAVALTFLDPVCNTDCPVIAQEMREAGTLLGAADRHVALVAIVANPLYHSLAYVKAFDQQERLGQVPNWQFLTGSLDSLGRTWNSYGIQVINSSAGAMVGHTELVYVIDPRGHTRYVLNSDIGPASQASKSSFSGVLASYLTKALNS
jgi:cytochrome oxidase Cu insertion factor (SCO1/SenC/PrrC family)